MSVANGVEESSCDSGRLAGARRGEHRSPGRLQRFAGVDDAAAACTLLQRASLLAPGGARALAPRNNT